MLFTKNMRGELAQTPLGMGRVKRLKGKSKYRTKTKSQLKSIVRKRVFHFLLQQILFSFEKFCAGFALLFSILIIPFK